MMDEKIVGYTTGVFDMFHIGHLHILKKAKNHCDYLVVGVSSDELVQSYKGITPIIPLSDRMEIIMSLNCVDEVIIQRHRDKKRQFDDIGYDTLFVGDDWQGSEIFNELDAYLSKYGAEVTYFPYTQKVSSTQFRRVLEDIHHGEYD